jgi:hypothetical protein
VDQFDDCDAVETGFKQTGVQCRLVFQILADAAPSRSRFR